MKLGLTKEQLKKYRIEVITASFGIVIGIILVFGVGSLIKLWQSQGLNSWDAIILTINFAVMIIKNGVEFIVDGFKRIKVIKKRVGRKKRVNKKRGVSDE